jgi:hypothetical protein
VDGSCQNKTGIKHFSCSIAILTLKSLHSKEIQLGAEPGRFGFIKNKALPQFIELTRQKECLNPIQRIAIYLPLSQFHNREDGRP